MTTAVKRKRICGFLPKTEVDGRLTQKACKILGSWTVGVVLVDKHRTDEVTLWFEKLIVCNRHRQALTVDDVVTDTGWKKMVAAVMAQGHAKPKRGYTKLTFKHLRLDLR